MDTATLIVVIVVGVVVVLMLGMVAGVALTLHHTMEDDSKERMDD